jgi:hypothetical protein
MEFFGVEDWKEKKGSKNIYSFVQITRVPENKVGKNNKKMLRVFPLLPLINGLSYLLARRVLI